MRRILQKNEIKILIFMGQNTNIKCYSYLLQGKLKISLQSCSNRINSLVDKELLIRKKEKHDSRKYLYLTNNGKKVVKEMLKIKKILK